MSNIWCLFPLEAVSKPPIKLCESFRTEDRSGKFVKGLEMRSTAFVTNLESPKVAEPTERAFDNVSCLSQPATVRVRFPQRRQGWLDPQPPHELGQCLRAVPGVPLQDLGLRARSTSRSTDYRHLDQQRQRHGVIARVGRTDLHDQGHAPRIRQDMTLTTGFPTVRRIWARVVPPKTARTLALSITARSRLIAPAFPRVDSRRVCSFDHTDNCVHSANRRQQVLPLPQFISDGRACHGMPVFNTKIMPVRTRRCDTGGRPPLGDGGGTGGSRGSICSHSSSDTSSAMCVPPCITWRPNTT